MTIHLSIDKKKTLCGKPARQVFVNHKAENATCRKYLDAAKAKPDAR